MCDARSAPTAAASRVAGFLRRCASSTTTHSQSRAESADCSVTRCSYVVRTTWTRSRPVGRPRASAWRIACAARGRAPRVAVHRRDAHARPRAHLALPVAERRERSDHEEGTADAAVLTTIQGRAAAAPSSPDPSRRRDARPPRVPIREQPVHPRQLVRPQLAPAGSPPCPGRNSRASARSRSAAPAARRQVTLGIVVARHAAAAPGSPRSFAHGSHVALSRRSRTARARARSSAATRATPVSIGVGGGDAVGRRAAAAERPRPRRPGRWR